MEILSKLNDKEFHVFMEEVKNIARKINVDIDLWDGNAQPIL